MSGIVLESFISCSQADELLALDEEISDEETSPLILGTVRFVAVVSFRKIRVLNFHRISFMFSCASRGDWRGRGRLFQRRLKLIVCSTRMCVESTSRKGKHMVQFPHKI